MRFSPLCLSALVVLSSPVLAHGDHDEEDEAHMSAEQTGRTAIVRLITQAKLPSSWTKATLVSTKPRTVKGLRQTVLTFRNPAVTNPAQQSLFVVLDNKHAFLSAGHLLK
jgi:hypothetical protein